MYGAVGEMFASRLAVILCLGIEELHLTSRASYITMYAVDGGKKAVSLAHVIILMRG